MMKKIFIVGLIACGFLVVSISPSVIAEGPYTITDTTGDVLNYYTYEIATSSPNININNIDIVEMTYSRQGGSVTLTLEVNGSIENKGSISDLESDVMEGVAYSLTIYNSTSTESYAVYYVNNECQITYESTDDTEDIPVSTLSAEGSTLAVSFDLLSNDETYDTIEAVTEYYKISSGEDNEYLIDMAPDVVDDVVDLEVIIDAPPEGIIGENIDFSGEVVDGGTSTSYTWAWEFGDGNTSNLPNPTHKYSEPGTYEVNLSVADADGNQGEDYWSLDISDNEPSNGGSQDGDDTEEPGLILFVVIIAIIVIAGIAAVVYIIRR